METMGRVYRSLGLYDQAQSLLEESLRIRRQTLGPDHLDVAENEINLALVLQGLEKPDESEALTRKALEIYRRHGGTANPEYAAGLNNLGGTLEDGGSRGRRGAFSRSLATQAEDPRVPARRSARAYNNLGKLSMEG